VAQYPTGTAKLMTFYSVTLARTIWLPDDAPRTEIFRGIFNVLMCKFYKFYICAVVGIIIEYPYIIMDGIVLPCSLDLTVSFDTEFVDTVDARP